MFTSYINAIKHIISDKNDIQLRAVLKLNNVLITSLKEEQIGGGGAGEDEQKLIDMITPLKEKIQDIQKTNLQINDLVDSKKQLKDLIEFIYYIHEKLPTDNNIKILSGQMKEINRIVNKYY